jgi:hypothetical protein
MSLFSLQVSLLFAAILLAARPVWAEPLTGQQAGATTESPMESSAPTFSQEDLDQALAPIALYPDDLLAQILMASTYPLEIVQAARWQSANPNVKDKALEDAMQKQPWDPSVKALTAVPVVLKQMNDKIEWTQKLGDMFLAQKSDVMATVQHLRAKADSAGNLKSTKEQNVKVEPMQENNAYNSNTPPPEKIYIIESTQPEVVYVPTYSPSVAYGPWWYSSPPYYVYPPAYVYPPGVAFATGMFVGAAIWGSSNWHHGDVDIDVNKHNNFNKSNINNGKWNHNAEHRKGVAYQDKRVAQQHNRGANTRDVQSREQFRGRGEQGRDGVGTSDRGAGGDRGMNSRDSIGTSDRSQRAGAGTSDRGAGGDRGMNSRDSIGTSDRSQRAGAGTSDRGAGGDRGMNRREGGDRGGGFSGVGSGASTRDASARGGASRSSANRGGGMSRGGGGGGGRSRGGGGRR